VTEPLNVQDFGTKLTMPPVSAVHERGPVHPLTVAPAKSPCSHFFFAASTRMSLRVASIEHPCTQNALAEIEMFAKNVAARSYSDAGLTARGGAGSRSMDC